MQNHAVGAGRTVHADESAHVAFQQPVAYSGGRIEIAELPVAAD